MSGENTPETARHDPGGGAVGRLEDPALDGDPPTSLEDAVRDYRRAFPDTVPGESGPGAVNTAPGIAEAFTLPAGEGEGGCPPPGGV